MDLTTHIPGNRAWIKEYAAQIGWDSLTAYYNKIFVWLLDLPAGTDYQIIGRVNPEHYDLFIKCVCLAMDEVASTTYFDKSYYIEQQATVISVR